MKRSIDLVMFDNLNTSQRYEVLNDIFQDLFKDIMDFVEVSKKMNLVKEQKKRLKDALEVIYNVET